MPTLWANHDGLRINSMSQIVEYNELADLTGANQVAAIKRNLEEQGIRTFVGVGPKKLWTTIGLIEAAGGIVNRESKESHADEYF